MLSSNQLSQSDTQQLLKRFTALKKYSQNFVNIMKFIDSIVMIT